MHKIINKAAKQQEVLDNLPRLVQPLPNLLPLEDSLANQHSLLQIPCLVVVVLLVQTILLSQQLTLVVDLAPLVNQLPKQIPHQLVLEQGSLALLVKPSNNNSNNPVQASEHLARPSQQLLRLALASLAAAARLAKIATRLNLPVVLSVRSAVLVSLLAIFLSYMVLMTNIFQLPAVLVPLAAVALSEPTKRSSSRLPLGACSDNPHKTLEHSVY